MNFYISQKSNNLKLASQCLTFQSDPHRVLSNGTSSVNDLLLAHLCAHKLIENETQRIKDKYNLAMIPNWTESILGVGKKKQKRLSVAERKQKNTERKSEEKARRQLKRKRDEWLVENINPSDLPGAPKNSALPCESEPITPANSIVVKEKKKNVTKERKLKITNDFPAQESPSIVKKRADSFFFTEKGTNYMSTAVIDRTQAPNPNDGLDRKERRAQKFGKSTGPPNKHKKQLHQMPNNKVNREPAKSSFSVTTNDLHPSWAAKQAKKGITQFQGKKMKFDDAPPPIQSDLTKSSTSAEDKLHPSWAAKQKQKPVISEFTGKKITFDDD